VSAFTVAPAAAPCPRALADYPTIDGARPSSACGAAYARCGAEERQALEQLCLYITRPALVNEWCNVTPPGKSC
jgi:hypothetical protein